MKLLPASNVNFTAKNTVRAEYTEVKEDGSVITISETYDKATGRIIASKKTFSADNFNRTKTYKDGSSVTYSQYGNTSGATVRANGRTSHFTTINGHMPTKKELAKLLRENARQESEEGTYTPAETEAYFRELLA